MKVGVACCTLLMLGLVACGGAKGSATVSGTDPASIRTSPAGAVTLAFTDIETLTPAMITGSSPLPSTITTSTPAAGTTRYTYAAVPAANTGSMSGYVDVLHPDASTYSLDYHLAVPSSTISGASEAEPLTATVTGWTYTGSATLTLSSANAATLSVPGITATYTDAADATKDKTYSFTGSLAATWVDNVSATLSGSYAFAQTLPANSPSISVTIGQSLVWGPFTTCSFPLAGSLTLNLKQGSVVVESATATFTSTCGQMTLDGAALTLGH